MGNIYLLTTFVGLCSCTSAHIAPDVEIKTFNDYSTEGILNYIRDPNFKEETLMKDICPEHFTCKNTSFPMSLMTSPSQCCACTCADDCLIRGTCCADKDFRNIVAKEMPGSLTTGKREVCSQTLFSAYVRTPRAHVLIKSCDVQFRDTAIIVKCLNNSQTTADEMEPVINRGTNETYANKYCAFCNNIRSDSILSWDSVVTCEDSIAWSKIAVNTTSSNDIFNNIILNRTVGCDVYWQTDIIDISQKKCFLPKFTISDCERPLSQDLHQLCLHSPQNLYISKNRAYKNIYCLMSCSKVFAKGHNNCIEGQGDRNRIELPPFTVLIDVKDTANPKTTEPNKCLQGMFFNKEVNQCLRLTCPPSSTLVNGRCKSILKKTNAPFEYRLELRYDLNNTLPSMSQLFQHAILPFSRDSRGISDLQFNLCTNELTYVNRTNKDATYYLRVVENPSTLLNPRTRFDEISERIDAINTLDNEYTVTFSSYSIASMYSSSISFLYFSPPSEMDHELSVLLKMPVRSPDGKHPSCEENSLAMTPLQFCDAVILDRQAAKDTSKSTKIVSHGLVFQNTEYFIRSTSGVERYQVCLKDFISKQLKLRSPLSEYQVNTTVNSTNEPAKFLSAFVLGVISFACTSMSVIALIVLIIIQFSLKLYKTSAPNLYKLLMATNLLLAQCLFLFGIAQYEEFIICYSIGIALHYLWLAYIGWTTACMFHIYYTFVVRTMAISSNSTSLKLKGVLFSQIFPLPFIASNIVYSYIVFDNFGYGSDLCYISEPLMVGLTFVLPLGVLVTFNIILFSAFVAKSNLSSDVLKKNNSSKEYSTILIFLRVSTLTGATWITGFIYNWTEIEWFEYLFILLNAGQGMFLLGSFISSRRTYSQIRTKLRSVFTNNTRA